MSGFWLNIATKTLILSVSFLVTCLCIVTSLNFRVCIPNARVVLSMSSVLSSDVGIGSHHVNIKIQETDQEMR